MTIPQIAEYIWVNELDGKPEDTSDIQKIVDYLSLNVGQLNVLLNMRFEVDSSNVVSPPLLDEESSILVQIYLRDYYKKKARTVLHSTTTVVTPPSSGGESEWTELREGDSVIKRVAQIASPGQKTTISKSYQNLSDQADKELKNLVQKYNLYIGKPRQVISDNGSSLE